MPHNQMSNPRGFRKQDPAQTHGPVKVLLSPKIKNLFNEYAAVMDEVLCGDYNESNLLELHNKLARLKTAVKSLEFAVPLAPAPSTGNAQRGTRNEARSLESSRPPQYRSGR